MNYEDIRKIDRLVAEHVMGLILTDVKANLITRPYDDREYPLPNYSTSIDDTWEVVEELKGDEYSLSCYPDGWFVQFHNKGEYHQVTDRSLPLAICLAALKTRAITVKIESNEIISIEGVEE